MREAVIVSYARTGLAKSGRGGFNITPPYLPGGCDDFVDMVIPVLQERRLFRTDYTGTTLREHLGLTPAVSRYARASHLPAAE